MSGLPLLKKWARLAFHSGGGLAVARFMRRSGVRILTYHRFPATQAVSFAQHCAYIHRYYTPVPLSQVVAALRGEAILPPRALAVTIDDGYRDVHDVAFPVFQRYGIPATVFLATGFLDGDCWLWVDQVRYVISRSARLRTHAEQEAAIAHFKEQAKRASDAERRRLVASLPDTYGVPLPEVCPDECSPLTWEQVRLMRRTGTMEFGAHTQTHPILSRVGTREELEREIAGSRMRIEQELQEHIDIFCYPNGRLVDISSETKQVVAASGFRAAVTTEAGRNFPGEDMLLLRRISVDASDSPRYFRERVAEL